MRNLYNQRLITTLFIVLVVSLASCSDGDDNVMEPEQQESEIDFTTFSGKYLGSWSWESVNGIIIGPISMEIAAPINNEHTVKFYQTHKFEPDYNSDGVTPEAIGTTTITNAKQVTIDLVLKTDAPPCNGNFTGSGSLSLEGRLVLNMDIFEDCTETEPAVFNLVKVANL